MSLPKYLKVKNALLSKIQNGEFEPGDKFYSESELISMFKVSSITVIRALKELVDEGYLTSIQGKGRFISKGKIGQMVKFTDIERYPDADISVVIKGIHIVEDENIKKKLGVLPNQKVYCFERLRKSNEQPYFLQYSYISSEFINESDIAVPELFLSIYDKMRKDFGFHLTTAPSEEYYTIKYPTPKHIAELLELATQEPTSFASRTTYLHDDKVFEYIKSYKRWDYYCSKVENS